VIDVSNPLAPVELGSLDTPGDALDVEVAGRLVFVADGTQGLRLIDASNRAAPVEVGSYTAHPGYSVTAGGGLLYVAAGVSGLRILDVSDPERPLELGGPPLIGLVRCRSLSPGQPRLSRAWRMAILRRVEATLVVLNELEARGIVRRYAIGGAMALLFHTEPVVTFDLDVFCLLGQSGRLVSLAPIYDFLRARGDEIGAEHVRVAGIPVQFIPAYNALVTEAVEQAEDRSFGSTITHVVRLEHLLAIMLQTDRAKDRERAALLATSGAFDAERLDAILDRYDLATAWNRIRSPR
jgi:hypothetical protein